MASANSAALAASVRPGLRLEGLSMRFGGVRVFEDVSLTVPPAQVTGCIGPNGAGKTTLINVICGVYKPVGGRAVLDGQSLEGVKPHQTIERGLARTFQDVRIFPFLSARDNVLVAMPAQRGELVRNLGWPRKSLEIGRAHV